MKTWALVPAKPLCHAKQRLSGVLAPVERYELVEHMLAGVLGMLTQVSGLAGVAVVTRDDLPAGARAHRIEDPGGGLNAACAHGLRTLGGWGADGALVIPGDVPLAEASEIECLLRALRERPVVVVPDRHGRGTNALGLALPSGLAPGFGVNSFGRHMERARQAGLAASSLTLSGIGFDVDTPDDLARYRMLTAWAPARAAHQPLEMEVV